MALESGGGASRGACQLGCEVFFPQWMLRGRCQDCCTHFGMGFVPDTRRAKERQEGESGTRGEEDTRCHSPDKD